MPVDWGSILSDPDVLRLLKRLLSKNTEEFLPTVTGDGRIVYGDESLGEDVPRVLDKLTAAGVFEKKTEARLLACPQHENAFELVPRVRCQACNSMRMKRGTLYQHNCGNISPFEAFGQKCPKCGKPTSEATLKLVGAWWECEDCKTRAPAPTIFLYCRRHDHDFPAAQARLVDQASYKLTPEASSELKQRLGPLIGILEGLQAMGVKARMSETMKGKSGVTHTFDIVIEAQGRKIPVDVKVAPDGNVQVIAVLSMYAKVLDVETKPSVLVAIPALAPDARVTANTYGLTLVEAKEPSAVVGLLLGELGIAPSPSVSAGPATSSF